MSLSEKEQKMLNQRFDSTKFKKTFEGRSVYRSLKNDSDQKFLFYPWMIIDSRTSKNRPKCIRKIINDNVVSDTECRDYLKILMIKHRYIPMIFLKKNLRKLVVRGYINIEAIQTDKNYHSWIIRLLDVDEIDTKNKKCVLYANHAYKIDELLEYLKNYPEDSKIVIKDEQK